jgi:hypothetical protein
MPQDAPAVNEVAPREPTLDDLAQRFQREAEGQGRERAQGLVALGFRDSAVDRVLGTSPPAAQDGSSVAHAGPRIELRDVEEWLVKADLCEVGCGVARDGYGCTEHLDGQHIATGTNTNGDARVFARWPITPAASPQDGSSEPHGSSDDHSDDESANGRV